MIDKNIEFLSDAIKNAKLLFVPTRRQKSNHIELPPSLIKLIQIKNKLRKQWQSNRSSEIKTLINKLTFDIRTKIQNIKNHLWARKLEKVKPGDNSLWGITKKFKNKNTHVPSLKNGSGMALTNKEKTEVLADTFATSYTLTQNHIHMPTTKKVANSLRSLDKNLNFDQSISQVNNLELINIVKHLKMRKAPGIDKIDNILIKNLPFNSFQYLTKIFNACLSFGYFPSIWKTAKIHPIKKPGKNASEAISYRPISLLPTLSKIFEKVILSRLKESVKDKLINEQFGFREGHSTVHQITRLTEHISAGMNVKKSSGLLMIDAEKAFDTVWHDGLIYKLKQNDTPEYIIRTIRSYLSGRSYVVSLNDEYSIPRNIPAGVPQGSILGPYLFILYTNDIPILKNTILSMYADDTAVVTSSYSPARISSKLNKSFLILNDYFKKWRIKINQSKTEAIIFSARRKPLPIPFKTEDVLTLSGRTALNTWVFT